MLLRIKYLLLLLSLFGYRLCGWSQTPMPGPAAPDSAGVNPKGLYTIGEISITGNEKTKTTVILRELPIHAGESFSLHELLIRMEESRRLLLNTSLFHDATVAVREFRDNEVNLTIQVKERWYLFPVPVLKPVDRNLNQWLVEKKADLSRINYGVKLMYNNATGRNDKLRLWLINGYTRQLSFSYDRMYVDKKLKWGSNAGFSWGKNRELNYNTINDKQVFLKDDGNYVRNYINGYFGLTYRPAIRTRHQFGISFSSEEVSDTIVFLNPAYFKQGRNRIGYPGLYYTMDYTDLNYIPYPTRGTAAKISISKNGLNRAINLWQLQAKGMVYHPLGPRSFLQLIGFAGLKLPFRQPYFNRRFLGYGDLFLQGYEYYVIDGVAGGFFKTTLTRELTHFRLRAPRVNKAGSGEQIPVRIYGKIYGNTGYVYNPQPGENALSNKWLFTGGIGLDIVTVYDLTIRLEWSFNQLGQNGLFLHRKTIF